MDYMDIREQMCDVCHKMWQLGWVAANDGNVSVKLPDGNFLATPTGATVVLCDLAAFLLFLLLGRLRSGK